MNFVRQFALRLSEMSQIKGEFDECNLLCLIVSKGARMKTEVISGELI